MHNAVNSVAKNSGILIAGNVATTVVGMLSNILLIRYLGAGDFGLYSFIFVYLGFFGILMDLGISRILVRELARGQQKAPALVGNALILRFFLSLISLVLAVAIIALLNYPQATKNLIYLASLSFLFSFSSVYPWIFHSRLKMGYPVAAGLLAGILRLVFYIWLAYIKAGLFWFVIITIVSEFPGLLAIIMLSRRFVRPLLRIDPLIIKNMVRESWPIAVTAGFIMIFTRIDQVMLFQMLGKEATGNYAAIVKLAEAFNLIPSAFIAPVFILMSKYFIESKTDFKRVYEYSFKYMAIFIAPVIVLITIFASDIIGLFYGRQYIQATGALQVLIWSEIFVFLGVVHLNALIAAGLQKFDIIFTVVSAFFNIGLNLLLIPAYGIAGASIATVISYGIGVPLSCLIKRTRPYGVALVLSTIRPLFCAAIMGIISYFVIKTYFVFNMLLGLVIYLALLVLFRGLDRQDFIWFKKIIYNKNL